MLSKISAMTNIESANDLNSQLDKWQLQLRKGVLVYMVLNLLNRQEMYGYALISSLSDKMAANMAEGTIYPLLNRMVRNGNISFDWRIMETGPARKYYQITGLGKDLLAGMHEHWQGINENIQGLRDD
jgi:PadR family transcriptional regulator PadR